MSLAGRKVLLVGGGADAARKATRLVGCGAQLEVVATELDAALQALLDNQQLVHHKREWLSADLQQASLVVAASGDTKTDLAICEQAHAIGCWVNVANKPDMSSFLIPSLIDRSPLLVAVSSSGSSPVLARLLTARIDAFLPHTYSELGKLADRYRDIIVQRISDWRQRRRFWERLLNGRVGEMILQGRSDHIDTELETAISEFNEERHDGEVYLVGAGPGDPDLLSFRALRLMQQCDVVLYDRLVSEPIMDLVNKSAEKIYVGKQRNNHAVPQESINAQLVSQARSGKRVLRLKGGDPFIFGRGGEEIDSLAADGIAFQVVPGVTAAAGCASYAGIPLTHRDYSQACLFVTGHLRDGSVDLDWPALARNHQTVVIYMGLLGLPIICEQLIKHGLPPSHPIALVAQGTRSNQQVLTGTLDSLAETIDQQTIKPPTLIIVGEVVKLREKLAWFEGRT
ncbi:MAG: siroheme synthase CysG [Granulosicoccus sp.]